MFLQRNVDLSQGWIENFDSYILTFLNLTFESYLETFEMWKYVQYFYPMHQFLYLWGEGGIF
jgi:hypothetical protein